MFRERLPRAENCCSGGSNHEEQCQQDNAILQNVKGKFFVDACDPAALMRFVEKPPEGFAAAYEDEHDARFEFGNRNFWRRHDLISIC
jgi:hypothetical protein